MSGVTCGKEKSKVREREAKGDNTMSGKRSTSKSVYRNLLQRSPDDFLTRLADNIMQGPARQDHVLLQLDQLEAHDMTDLLLKFRRDSVGSLLQLAAIFHGDVMVMTRLASLCPQLLQMKRQGEYEGQNVLHTLVSKQNVEGAEALLQHPDLKEPWLLLNGKAVGLRFAATVMMGELPLSVAALTFNLEMVDLLLQHGAKLHAANTGGDTVLHSLLRFTHLYPEREEEVAEMMREIHTRLQSPKTAPWPQVHPRSVWLMENDQGLTALRLAAALALPLLFRLILQLEGVYCQLDRHDGLFDSLLYDVTEIDPVAHQQWREVNTRDHYQRRHGVVPLPAHGFHSPTHYSMKDVGCCPGVDTPSPSAMKTKRGRARLVSVLEIICETGRVDKGFQILSTYVVRSVVKAKWRHYRWWFLLWAFLHVLLMTLVTVHAVFKARLIQAAEERSLNPGTSPAPSDPNLNLTNASSSPPTPPVSTPDVSVSEKTFVQVMAVLVVPLSLMIVLWEVVRWRMKLALHLRLIHHNGLYRLQLFLLAVSLVADSVWYWISGPVNNVLLTLVLLVGWWFCTFFLRPWRKFSFFTVMLQKVLLGDMLRFSAIILLELLAFSAAMYVTFLATPGDLPDDFEHLGVTMLTMFKLMLGLGEIEVLGKASHPWVSTMLFVLFVLLTYLLMLNALIAMMSNTCSLVSEDKVSQWELQRLSVVLLLESMLACRRLLFNSGKPMFVAAFDLRRKEIIQETRYFTKVTSVQSTYTERGAAIMKRKDMIQTLPFEDLHAPMSSRRDAVTSAGHVAHLDLLASFTHQQALLGRFAGAYEDEYSESRAESSDLTMYGMKNYSSSPTHLHSNDAVGKAKERMSNWRKADLPAIKESEESEPEATRKAQGQGQGQGQSYISMRQSLLQASAAAKVAKRFSAQRQAGVEQTTPTNSPAPNQREQSLADHNHIVSSSPATEDSLRDTVDAEETKPSSVTLVKSPHTPKSVQLVVHPPQEETSTATLAPRQKRKRHNSDRVVRKRTSSRNDQHDSRSQTFHFQSDEGKAFLNIPQESVPLPSERHGASAKPPDNVAWRGRQLTRTQSESPSPDVFTIAPEATV